MFNLLHNGNLLVPIVKRNNLIYTLKLENDTS